MNVGLLKKAGSKLKYNFNGSISILNNILIILLEIWLINQQFCIANHVKQLIFGINIMINLFFMWNKEFSKYHCHACVIFSEIWTYLL